MKASVTLVRTLTPLHVGTGQAAGPVDLPIAREKATNWPIIPGSSVKGVLRDVARSDLARPQIAAGIKAEKALSEAEEGEMMRLVFGLAGTETSQAGALAISDLRMLFFPVRSFSGTFAYACSPLSLTRFLDLADIAGIKVPGQTDLDGLNLGDRCMVLGDTVLKGNNQQKILLEDLDIETVKATPEVEELATFLAEKLFPEATHRLLKRFVLLSDTAFTFLNETATEITTHVSLDALTKTAKKGFLRSDETVPAEAVFAGIATSSGQGEDRASDHLARLNKALLQFGGKASTGLGLCVFNVFGGSK